MMADILRYHILGAQQLVLSVVDVKRIRKSTYVIRKEMHKNISSMIHDDLGLKAWCAYLLVQGCNRVGTQLLCWNEEVNLVCNDAHKPFRIVLDRILINLLLFFMLLPNMSLGKSSSLAVCIRWLFAHHWGNKHHRITFNIKQCRDHCFILEVILM